MLGRRARHEQAQCPARAALACVRPSLSGLHVGTAGLLHGRCPAGWEEAHVRNVCLEECVCVCVFQEVAPLPKDYLCWGRGMEGTLCLLHTWTRQLSLSIDISFPSKHKARVRIQEKISGPGIKTQGQEGHPTPHPLPTPCSLRR